LITTETCRDIEYVYCDINNIIEVETVLIVYGKLVTYLGFRGYNTYHGKC